MLDHSTSRILGTINFQLRSRKQAGFMLSRDWLKLLDPKVIFYSLDILEWYVCNPFKIIQTGLVKLICW